MGRPPAPRKSPSRPPPPSERERRAGVGKGGGGKKGGGGRGCKRRHRSGLGESAIYALAMDLREGASARGGGRVEGRGGDGIVSSFVAGGVMIFFCRRRAQIFWGGPEEEGRC